MFSELLTLLKQENNQIQKDGMLKDAMSKVFQNQSFKVRESLTYNLVKLQHQIQENQIYSFCQNLIKQIWVMEKHPNVRNILKNQEMLEMQKQLFSRDLTTISQKIKQDFDKHMKEIEDLQNSLIDVDNQEEILQKLRQAQDDFEAYLENITEMSQKLDITIMFLKDMTKDLKSIKGKVDKVLTSVNAIEEDVRRLRGKSWQELLEIRKKKVEQQKIEAELDQIHIDILTIEYDPATGQKIEDSHGVTTSSLLKEDYDDFQGEVNEFLWCESETRKDIMLLQQILIHFLILNQIVIIMIQSTHNNIIFFLQIQFKYFHYQKKSLNMGFQLFLNNKNPKMNGILAFFQFQLKSQNFGSFQFMLKTPNLGFLTQFQFLIESQ